MGGGGRREWGGSDVDYIYDIPRMLAKAVTGYGYDDAGLRVYENLERIKRWWFF